MPNLTYATRPETSNDLLGELLPMYAQQDRQYANRLRPSQGGMTGPLMSPVGKPAMPLLDALDPRAAIASAHEAADPVLNAWSSDAFGQNSFNVDAVNPLTSAGGRMQRDTELDQSGRYNNYVQAQQARIAAMKAGADVEELPDLPPMHVGTYGQQSTFDQTAHDAGIARVRAERDARMAPRNELITQRAQQRAMQRGGIGPEQSMLLSMLGQGAGDAQGMDPMQALMLGGPQFAASLSEQGHNQARLGQEDRQFDAQMAFEREKLKAETEAADRQDPFGMAERLSTSSPLLALLAGANPEQMRAIGMHQSAQTGEIDPSIEPILQQFYESDAWDTSWLDWAGDDDFVRKAAIRFQLPPEVIQKWLEKYKGPPSQPLPNQTDPQLMVP